MRKRFVHLLWGLFMVLIITSALAFTAIARGWMGYVPPLDELQSPINKFASQVISSDGKMLGTWSRNENRIFVSYEAVSPFVYQALIATEDVRFYDHSGIDIRALVRAVVKRGIMGNANAGGGSTITQQLAKQLYSSTANSAMERLLQKPIEWVIAVKLERNYTKEEILTLYLNYFDFLHNAVGIKTAANTYFGKQPKELDLNEGATLIGMCKNPAFFNPIRYPERCRERRNIVLQQMEKAGYISPAECAENSEKPLVLNFHRIDHKDGMATYFREHLRMILMAQKPVSSEYAEWQKQKYYEDSLAWEIDPLYGWCNKNFKKDGSNYNIYTDGLKIYSTIDSRMQKYAEAAVYRHIALSLQPAFEKEKRSSAKYPFSKTLSQKQINEILRRSMLQSERYRSMKKQGYSDEEIKQAFNTKQQMTIYTYRGEIDTLMTPMDSIRYYKSFLRAGFMSMDPMNGQVKAYVGGINYTHFQYDMCMGGRRQVGSTIKPFLYALAMENGYSPFDVAPNVQQTYHVAGKTWTPRNASTARYGQMVTLKWGLSQSNNWISAYLISKLSPAAFVRLLHEFGVRNKNIHPSMSLCLGPCDISVSEMVSAYTAFANRGIRSTPQLVTRIEDSEGNRVAEFQPVVNEVINEESAYKMLEMLKAVIDQGTGGRIRHRYHIKAEMGGKTGTTNNNSDGWFIGFVPRLVNGCWVGGEDPDIHFDTMRYGQGASMALPIWALFMQKVYADKTLGYSQDEKFDIPEKVKKQSSDAQKEEESIGIDDIFE
ncbi:MAG: transglycosylase domain-containing protein [Bacteroidaceae bacterium]